MDDKDIVKVTIHYEDGTTKEVDKGIMMTEEPCKTKDVVTFYPVNVKTLDIASITISLMQLADRLGVFDNLKHNENQDDEF